MTALSTEEVSVLRLLDSVYDNDQCCHSLRAMAKVCGGDVDMARCAVRTLAVRGFAAFERGLFDADGRAAGSGYRCTKTGRVFLAGIPSSKQLREDAARVLAKAAGQDPDARVHSLGPNYGKPHWWLHSRTAMAIFNIFRRGEVSQ